MRRIDPELEAALATQLELRRQALARGARRVGWKLGMGDRESIGGNIAVGFLTTATLLPTNSIYTPEPGSELCADAEAAVELAAPIDPAGSVDAAEASIGRYAAALELVDLRPLQGEPAAVVKANVFHRAVVFAPLDDPPHPMLEVSALLNGREAAAGRWPPDIP